MKNTVDLAADTHNLFDAVVVEDCQKYNECGDFKTYFTDKGKAVFAVEYNGASSVCSKAPMGFTQKYCTNGYI